jgi:predicted aldo/keto reductase-like oxidoreductase
MSMSNTRRTFLKSVAGLAGSVPLLSHSSRAQSTTAVPKRKFGRHDEMISVVGLGGHTLYYSKDKKAARDICHHAIDLGINFFENAWCYHGGTAEEIMGYALEGKRDDIFLMTKVCTHDKPLPEGGKEGAMKMLEESLRRMKTDHLDLWMIHMVDTDEQVKKAYGPGGVIEALEQAKKEGKIRYTGFTGHTSPAAHAAVINGGYEFDANLMPVSGLGALSSRAFERELMPLCVEKNIAVLGMKGFGGSKRAHLHGKINIEEIVRYSLSYPQVTTHCVGIDKYEYVEPLMQASSKTPMSEKERAKFVAQLKAQGGEQYCLYLDPSHDRVECGHGHLHA